MSALDIFIGGAGDRRFKALVNFVAAYRERWPDREALYFTWRQGTRIASAIRGAQSKGRTVNAVGHSFGAYAAARVLTRHALKVDLLVTLDPISQFGAPLDPSAHAKVWVNVTARPSKANRTDYVAWLGSWRMRGAKTTLCVERATHGLIVEANHAGVKQMMTAEIGPAGGASVFSLLHASR